MSNPIIDENQQNGGSIGWNTTNRANAQIQAYVNATSYSVGDTLNIYVSTASNGTTYSISIYRLGWYCGLGGSLKLSVTGQVGVAQGSYDLNTKVLSNCPTAFIDNTTLLCEPRWAVSYTTTIPSNWTTGSYMVVIQDANGKQTQCHFVVKGNSSADFVVVRGDMTDCAYNAWGGHGLYAFNSFGGVVATKVSFDRPSVQQNGTDGSLIYELCAIKWLERQGYNLSYLSDIDVHNNAAQLQNYKGYISLGHDEYWTKEKYDGVLAARDAGVGLAFLGANPCETQIRLESGGQNGANRTVTCYRVASSPNTLANDPFFGIDNTRLTADWDDPILNRPQEAMVGIRYTSFVQAPGFNVAWVVDGSANSSLMNGTGLVDGSSYGYDIVGYEFDDTNVASPSNLQIIGNTPVTDINSHSKSSKTTVYVASSGALVFASGSTFWTGCLDAYRYAVQGGGTPAEIPQMQLLMANIMYGLQVNKSTKVFSALGFHG